MYLQFSEFFEKRRNELKETYGFTFDRNTAEEIVLNNEALLKKLCKLVIEKLSAKNKIY